MKKNIQKKIKSGALAIFLAAVFVISSFSLFASAQEMNKQQIQLKVYEQEISDIKEDIKNKKTLLSEENRQELIEQAARKKLNFAYPNEVVYKDVF